METFSECVDFALKYSGLDDENLNFEGYTDLFIIERLLRAQPFCLSHDRK